MYLPYNSNCRFIPWEPLSSFYIRRNKMFSQFLEIYSPLVENIFVPVWINFCPQDESIVCCCIKNIVKYNYWPTISFPLACVRGNKFI